MHEPPPIPLPRWALTLCYSLFGVLGVVAIIYGVPTLDLTTWAGYTSIWGGLTVVSAVCSAVGSRRPAWEPLERWAAAVLVSVISVYMVGGFIAGRGAGAVVLVIMMLLPAVRVAQLIRRTGVKR